MRDERKKKQKDTGAPMPGSQPVSQANAPSAQSMGGGFDEETKYYIEKGQRESKKSDYFMGNRPPSMRSGAERQQGRMTFDRRSVSDIGGDPGLLAQLDKMSTDPSKNTKEFSTGTRRIEPLSDKADAARQTKMREDQAIRRRDEERGFTDEMANKAKKELEDIYGQFGMEYEEGGQVKSKVMSMLDGMEDMPAEAEVVKMIVEEHGVSEDEAKAMIAEYKQSKMGGKTEYEGGGAMKLMRDPKDMVGMTMPGGAKIVS